jgi:hypothetical protein
LQFHLPGGCAAFRLSESFHFRKVNAFMEARLVTTERKLPSLDELAIERSTLFRDRDDEGCVKLQLVDLAAAAATAARREPATHEARAARGTDWSSP